MKIKYGVGNKYGLDLAGLWEMMANKPDIPNEITLSNGNTLEYSKEDKREYFDLRNSKGEMVCCDGELCEVLEENADYVELVEEDTQIRFRLNRREFEIAVMC